jgi:hypothetical protein
MNWSVMSSIFIYMQKVPPDLSVALISLLGTSPYFFLSDECFHLDSCRHLNLNVFTFELIIFTPNSSLVLCQ